MPGMVLTFQQFSNLLQVTQPLRAGARKKDHSHSLVLEGRQSPMFRSHVAGGQVLVPRSKKCPNSEMGNFRAQEILSL